MVAYVGDFILVTGTNGFQLETSQVASTTGVSSGDTLSFTMPANAGGPTNVRVQDTVAPIGGASGNTFFQVGVVIGAVIQNLEDIPGGSDVVLTFNGTRFVISSLVLPPPAPIRALGGDAYTNSTSFDAHPDWSAPSSFPNPNAQLQSFLPVPEVGEKWITAGVTGGNPMFADAVPMVNFEFEISKAFRTVGTPGLVGNGLFNIILTGSTGGGGFATINVSYNTAGDIEIQGVGYALTTVASAVLQPDENYYITFRHRRQSGLGVLDGVTEIYLNDQLIHSVTNLDGGLLERSSTWTSIFLDPRAQSNKWWKNITVFDQWTQADGVAPDILNVDDAGGFTETTSVVPLSYYVNVPSNGRYLNSPIVMI